jgi:membrane-associated phospholipid phosphatase
MSNAFLAALNFCAIFSYLLTNRWIVGGRVPRMYFDDYVRFVPLFVYPYTIGYFGWMFLMYTLSYAWPTDRLISLTFVTVTGSLIANALFVLFPTYVRCVRPEGETIAHRMLIYIHENDRPNNACPSLHVYFAHVLAWYSWSHLWWLNGMVLLLSLSISASTVFIKRHYVLDVIGGLVLFISVLFLHSYVIHL